MFWCSSSWQSRFIIEFWAESILSWMKLTEIFRYMRSWAVGLRCFESWPLRTQYRGDIYLDFLTSQHIPVNAVRLGIKSWVDVCQVYPDQEIFGSSLFCRLSYCASYFKFFFHKNAKAAVVTVEIIVVLTVLWVLPSSVTAIRNCFLSDAASLFWRWHLQRTRFLAVAS